GTTAGLYRIWGSSTLGLFVVGDKGAILHSAGHGATWAAASPATDCPLQDVWGSDANDLYAIGGCDGLLGSPAPSAIVLHSTDGGATWNVQNSGATKSLGGVWGSGRGDVFVGGTGGILFHTNDSGASWHPVATGTTAGLSHFWGTASNDIYATGGIDGV